MWDWRFISGVVITSAARNLLLLTLERPLRKQQITHELKAVGGRGIQDDSAAVLHHVAAGSLRDVEDTRQVHGEHPAPFVRRDIEKLMTCLLYTSDAADEEDSVDLGGRRIIK